jgi:hypothetical protein
MTSDKRQWQVVINNILPHMISSGSEKQPTIPVYDV